MSPASRRRAGRTAGRAIGPRQKTSLLLSLEYRVGQAAAWKAQPRHVAAPERASRAWVRWYRSWTTISPAPLVRACARAADSASVSLVCSDSGAATASTYTLQVAARGRGTTCTGPEPPATSTPSRGRLVSRPDATPRSAASPSSPKSGPVDEAVSDSCAHTRVPPPSTHSL